MFDDEDFNSWDQADQMAMMAYEMYENGEMSMALTQLDEAIEINPGNSAWLFNRGLTLDALERFSEAIESYERALEISPDDPEIMNSLAVDYTRTGRYDLAISTFEHIQKIQPDFEPCYCNRIITYTEIDQHDKAEEMFYLAQQINSDCPICFYNIGNSLFSRQKFERAIWCWKKTLLLEPTHPQINYRIAQAYWANGDIEEARKYFLEELRQNPGEIDVILDFGIFLLKNDDVIGAREKFNRIIELKPDFAPAIFYLGELELTQGNRIAAIKAYKEAMSKDDQYPGPRYRLAQLAIEDQDTEKASKYLEHEYDLDINDSDVLLSMGAMFLNMDQNDYATDCFLRVVDEDNENAEAFWCLGRSLAQREEYEGALQFFEHSLTLGKKDFDLLFDISQMYYTVGQMKMAAQSIAIARMLRPRDRKVWKLTLNIHTAMLIEKITKRISSTKLCQKLVMMWAGYKCRFRRVIHSKKRTPPSRQKQEDLPDQ